MEKQYFCQGPRFVIGGGGKRSIYVDKKTQAGCKGLSVSVPGVDMTIEAFLESLAASAKKDQVFLQLIFGKHTAAVSSWLAVKDEPGLKNLSGILSSARRGCGAALDHLLEQIPSDGEKHYFACAECGTPDVMFKKALDVEALLASME